MIAKITGLNGEYISYAFSCEYHETEGMIFLDALDHLRGPHGYALELAIVTLKKAKFQTILDFTRLDEKVLTAA